MRPVFRVCPNTHHKLGGHRVRVGLGGLCLLSLVLPQLDLFLPATGQLLSLLLTVPVLLLTAPFGLHGWHALWRGRPEAHTPLALGAGLGVVYSLVAMQAPQLLASTAAPRPDVYFDAVNLALSLAVLTPPRHPNEDIRGHRGLIWGCLAWAALTLLVGGLAGPGWAQTLPQVMAVLLLAQPAAVVWVEQQWVHPTLQQARALGLQFRDAAALSGWATVDTLLLDPTGLLTLGQPAFQDLRPAPGWASQDVLRLAASLPPDAQLPWGQALQDQARRLGLRPQTADHVQLREGQGQLGWVDGQQVLLGTEALMGAHQVALPHGHTETAAAWSAAGYSVVFCAIGGRLAGLLAIQDPLRPGAVQAVADLQAHGLQVILISRDSLGSAWALAHRVQVQAVHAELSAGETADIVQRLQQAGHTVGVARHSTSHPAQASLQLANETDTPVPALRWAADHLPSLAQARTLAIRAAQDLHWRHRAVWIYHLIGLPLAATLLSPVLAAALAGFWPLARLWKPTDHDHP